MQTDKHTIPNRFLPKIPKVSADAKNNTDMVQKIKIISKDELEKLDKLDELSKKVEKTNHVTAIHVNKLTTRTYN